MNGTRKSTDGKAAAQDKTDRFARFAQEVKSFEKTLYGLVASSFVLSGISTFVHADKFKSDPGLAAVTLLVGTIGGAAGVLVTYIGWAQHPIDDLDKLRRFRAADFAR